MLLLLLGGFASCGGDLNPEDEGNYRHQKVKDKPVMKTIRLQFGGDYVSESEEPLLRAEDGDTYTAINVFYKEKSQNEYEKYAYGLFNRQTPISVDVTTGYIYRFEATILKEREDYVRTLNATYTDPFKLHDWTSSSFDNEWHYQNWYLNNFQYSYKIEDNRSRPYFSQLSSGTAYVNSRGDLLDGNGNSITTERFIRYPRVKRFYGELPSFDPTESSEISIPMDYKCFGLRIELDSIPEGTSVTVKDITTISGPTPTDEPYLVFPKGLSFGFGGGESESWEGIYSLNDFDKPSVTFTLRFTWMKGAGKSEYFDYPVTVTAKKKKVLKLSIDGDVSETKSGNIIFTNMDETMEDEEERVSHDFNKEYRKRSSL